MSGRRSSEDGALVALARRFPADFGWGAATSAYQIEGAQRADGRVASIWDTFERIPGAIANGDTGEEACDHYRRWPADLDLMRELGLRAYRFSIAWPRVMGDASPNAGGLDFYDRLVDGLLERGIRPFVTLFHWDLPQHLQDEGGWAAPDAPARFAEYAAAVGGRLGDRVTDWATINEPDIHSFFGHALGIHAPGARDWGLALRVSDALLRAHAAAAEALQARCRREPAVGIVLHLSPIAAASASSADAEAAARADGYQNRWFLDPLFGRPYPADMVAFYAERFGERAAPADTPRLERPDVLYVNYYRRRVVAASSSSPLGFELVRRPKMRFTAMDWEIYPQGLGETLRRVHTDYRPGALVVSENGAAFDDRVEPDGSIADMQRVAFLFDHLAHAADVIADGIPLRGYFVWSLLDNLEWNLGYAMRMGIVHVDHLTQRRTPKASAYWYARLIAAATARE